MHFGGVAVRASLQVKMPAPGIGRMAGGLIQESGSQRRPFMQRDIFRSWANAFVCGSALCQRYRCRQSSRPGDTAHSMVTWVYPSTIQSAQSSPLEANITALCSTPTISVPTPDPTYL